MVSCSGVELVGSQHRAPARAVLATAGSWQRAVSRRDPGPGPGQGQLHTPEQEAPALRLVVED